MNSCKDYYCTVSIDGERYSCIFDIKEGLAYLTECEGMDYDQTEQMMGMVQICEMQAQCENDWDNGGRISMQMQEREFQYQEDAQ